MQTIVATTDLKKALKHASTSILILRYNPEVSENPQMVNLPGTDEWFIPQLNVWQNVQSDIETVLCDFENEAVPDYVYIGPKFEFNPEDEVQASLKDSLSLRSVEFTELQIVADPSAFVTWKRKELIKRQW